MNLLNKCKEEIYVKNVYPKIKEFKNKYPLTISWRLKSHSKVIDKHLNDGDTLNMLCSSKMQVLLKYLQHMLWLLLTKEYYLAQKEFFRVFFTAITPDMFNDLKVRMGIIWGTVKIDTVKERVIFSNIQKSALPEIENSITGYMMKEKKKYFHNNTKEENKR